MNCKNCKYFKDTGHWRWECRSGKIVAEDWLVWEAQKTIQYNDWVEYTANDYWGMSCEVWENFWCIHFKNK